MNKQDILNAYHYRHACKVYDPNHKINDEDFQIILETGQLSPSSFGFEPWRFLVIENRDILNVIRQQAWGAGDKATDCSHFIIILARQNSTLHPDSDYINQHIMQDTHHIPEDMRQLRREKYRQFTQHDAKIAQDPRHHYDWACKQCYIALANMMTTAAMMGIDSTAIEGFDYNHTNRILSEYGLFDADVFKIAVMVAFGYRVHEPRPKTRQTLNQIVQWIK